MYIFVLDIAKVLGYMISLKKKNSYLGHVVIEMENLWYL